MDDKLKRDLRQEKRDLKKAGKRKMRRQMQRNLTENPEEAHLFDFDYGMDSTAGMHVDSDRTRRREAPDQYDGWWDQDDR